LKTGYTTGACAAAAAKAAVLVLFEGKTPAEVGLVFPDGTRVLLPVLWARRTAHGAEAAVVKDAGDDPDVTHGSTVIAAVSATGAKGIVFAAGEGVGMVTKPGLQVPPGEPAINPAPRRMICEAVREVTRKGLRIMLSIPGGRELAARTFNPRLGVKDGLSILGTTGRVRPFSVPALRDALVCALDVAQACGVRSPVLVPGHIGERAARRHFRLTPDQVIPVGNEWGFMLDRVAERALTPVLIVGHPGKLGKLPEGHWDTHSSRSPMALEFVAGLAQKLKIAIPPDGRTVEGVFQYLEDDGRRRLGNALAAETRRSVVRRIALSIAVVLINMSGDLLGADGDLSPWQ
jgi:cobalt-precorrin-5B (C1)-methyltransferase